MNKYKGLLSIFEGFAERSRAEYCYNLDVGDVKMAAYFKGKIDTYDVVITLLKGVVDCEEESR